MQHLTSKSLPQTIISVLKECLPADRPTIGLHEPCFEGNEWRYVKDCLDTGWVSSVGQYVDRFENHLAEFTGVPRAVAVVNGTAGLHIALKLACVEAGDEVLVPALSFVAAANAVAYAGAIPHFVDSGMETLGVDAEKLGGWLNEISVNRNGECYNKLTGRRIKALIALHVFGHPADLDALSECCQRFHLELIEDAAEALGSFYKKKHVGNWGKFSVLSFNGNKIVTTSGGGAILTHDEKLATLAKHLTTTAKLPHAWAFNHDLLGYNYRLPNLNAALGCAQMEQLPQFLERKRALAERYEKAFVDTPGLRFFKEPKFAKSNYWLNALVLDTDYRDQRNEILASAHQNGILLRPVWTLLNKLPMFQNCPSMELPVAQDLEQSLINLPSSASL